MDEYIQMLSALLDFHSDRAEAHASFFVASLFGLFSVLQVAQNLLNSGVIFISLWITKAIWLVICWFLFYFGVYSYFKFGYYASYAHMVLLEMRKVVDRNLWINRHKKIELRISSTPVWVHKKLKQRVHKVIMPLYLIIVFLCCALVFGLIITSIISVFPIVTLIAMYHFSKRYKEEMKKKNAYSLNR